MIGRIFEQLANQEEAIVKEALLGAAIKAVGKPLLRLGAGAVKRPMATLGAAMTGADIASGSQRFSNMATAPRPVKPPMVG